MARFYANENVPAQVAAELRRLGHDVVTSLDAGKANSAMPDAEVLVFAVADGRILLTHNRRHFLRLHQHRTADHAGMVLCTFDADFCRQAQAHRRRRCGQPRNGEQAGPREPARLMPPGSL
jgi:predicted nuclease of predicted toxin-antitoxin system